MIGSGELWHHSITMNIGRYTVLERPLTLLGSIIQDDVHFLWIFKPVLVLVSSNFCIPALCHRAPFDCAWRGLVPCLALPLNVDNPSKLTFQISLLMTRNYLDLWLLNCQMPVKNVDVSQRFNSYSPITNKLMGLKRASNHFVVLITPSLL